TTIDHFGKGPSRNHGRPASQVGPTLRAVADALPRAAANGDGPQGPRPGQRPPAAGGVAARRAGPAFVAIPPTVVHPARAAALFSADRRGPDPAGRGGAGAAPPQARRRAGRPSKAKSPQGS